MSVYIYIWIYIYIHVLQYIAPPQQRGWNVLPGCYYASSMMCPLSHPGFQLFDLYSSWIEGLLGMIPLEYIHINHHQPSSSIIPDSSDLKMRSHGHIIHLFRPNPMQFVPMLLPLFANMCCLNPFFFWSSPFWIVNHTAGTFGDPAFGCASSFLRSASGSDITKNIIVLHAPNTNLERVLS